MSKKISAVEKLARLKLGCITTIIIFVIIFAIISVIIYIIENNKIKKYESLYENLYTQEEKSNNVNGYTKDEINEINKWWKNNSNVSQFSD